MTRMPLLPPLPLPLPRARVVELWRYYQVGAVNTAFGLGAYALLVWLGLGMYAAQFIAHMAGVAFNYLSYSRHVFRDAAPAKGRFVLSYAFNYLLGLGTLAAVARAVPSPYLAGLVAAVLVSFVNYFVLRHLIFLRKPA